MKILDVHSHCDKELATLAAQIATVVDARDELEDVTESFSVSKPYVDVRVDEVNDFTRFGRVYKVVMQADTSYRSAFAATRFLFVRNGVGELVPLDTLVTLTATTGAS